MQGGTRSPLEPPFLLTIKILLIMKYILNKSKIKCNNTIEAKSIEERMREMMQSGEPIEETAPQIFTERKNGVEPQYDIRTDRFEIALDAMDKVNRSNVAKAAEKIAPKQEPKTQEEQ